MIKLFAALLLTFFITLKVSADVPLNASYLHDPSTPIRCDGRWWVYTTGDGCPARSSSDLIHWENEPSVFAALPAWAAQHVPKNQNDNIWAPEVAFYKGDYRLYYAVSSWGSRVSAIGLATNPTLDPTNPAYKWTDHGAVVESSSEDNYNAIDPSVLTGPRGNMWLSFGSFFSGDYLIQLDPHTGKPIPSASMVHLTNTGEASYLAYHAEWHYLFFNIGTCCRGKNSYYNIRMGRAKSIIGPYLDNYGVPLTRGGGTLFLGSENGAIGPGQIGIFKDDGKDYFSCHEEWNSDYDHGRGAGAVLHIARLYWRNGWPTAGIAGTTLAPGKPLQLLNKRSGCVMETRGADVQQWQSWSGSIQQWRMMPTGNKAYEIVSVGDGQAVTATGGATVMQPLTGAAAQQWLFMKNKDGAYTIINALSGQALTAAGPRAGNKIIVSPVQPLDIQKWDCILP